MDARCKARLGAQFETGSGSASASLPDSRSDAGLTWQSKAILLLFLPVLAAHLVIFTGSLLPDGGSGAAVRLSPVAFAVSAGLAVALGLLVWTTRAATPGGALAGAITVATFALATPGWHSALWPLAALLLLTLAGTRLGGRTKEHFGLAEDRRGRTAAQVMANLGVAAAAALLLTLFPAHTAFSEHASFASQAHLSGSARLLRLALVAALAEAAADTLSSELGQVLGGEPRLLTSFARVPRGTDGAMTVAGTLCGWAAAAIVVAVAGFALSLGLHEVWALWLAAILGGLFDSLLGAVCERRRWLNNDAVNMLSTLFAALLAAAMLR